MYIYMESSPKLRGKARKFGRDYRRMAIVELEPGFNGRPKMISTRARGVVRVVADETHHVGATERSYGVQRYLALQAEVARLNDSRDAEA